MCCGVTGRHVLECRHPLAPDPKPLRRFGKHKAAAHNFKRETGRHGGSPPWLGTGRTRVAARHRLQVDNLNAGAYPTMESVSDRNRRAAAMRLSDQQTPTLARLLVNAPPPPPVDFGDFVRMGAMGDDQAERSARLANMLPAPRVPALPKMSPPPANAGALAAAPVAPDMPPPAQIGDVKTDVIGAIQKLLAAGKLPEQWRGAFANQSGESW